MDARTKSTPRAAGGPRDGAVVPAAEGGRSAYGASLKLGQLRALVAICESGTFSGAALDLDTSQPTLSNAIGELEARLGVRLLERGRFGAVPTEVGRRVIGHVRRLESVLEAIEQEAALEHGELRGRLRVAAFRSAAAKILPTALARLRARHPAMELVIVETGDHADHARDASLEGRADLAITTALTAGDLLFWELMRDPYVVVVHDDFTGPNGPLSVDAIVQHPVIFGNSVCWLPMRAHLAGRHPDFAPSFEVSEDSTMLGMVAQGLGLALMPSLAIDAMPAHVRQVPLAERVERRIGVSLPPASLKLPAVRALLAVLREMFPDGEIPPLD